MIVPLVSVCGLISSGGGLSDAWGRLALEAAGR